ncbi:hypothetical protein FXW78_51635, partial [Rhodococcus opacus]|nr:hypothetical protein [Rhodococcus opacus]
RRTELVLHGPPRPPPRPAHLWSASTGLRWSDRRYRRRSRRWLPTISSRSSAFRKTAAFLLLGWSFGGLVAHAIATALERRGSRFALLAMMDSVPVRGSPLRRDGRLRRRTFDSRSGHGRRAATARSSRFARYCRPSGTPHMQFIETTYGCPPTTYRQIYHGDVVVLRPTLTDDGTMSSESSPDRWRAYVTVTS